MLYMVKSDVGTVFPQIPHPEDVAGKSEEQLVQKSHPVTLSSAESRSLQSHSHWYWRAQLSLNPQYFLHCYNLHHSLSVT